MIEHANAGVEMVGLIRTMVAALVDRPDEVKVIGAFERENHGVVTVTVAPDEVGRVIGVRGRTARSLRMIVAAASRKLGLQVDLNIVNKTAEEVR